jgi:hypothetical protein
MDFSRSFTYIFEDPNWPVKVLIGGLVSLIPIINFAAIGFAVLTLKRAREGEVPVLPEWSDFGNLFTVGLTYIIGIFLLSVPALILIVLAAGASFFANFRLTELVFSGISLLLAVAVLLYFLVLFLLLPAIYINFARKISLSSFFEFSELFRIATANISLYVMCIVNIFIAYLAVVVFAAIPMIGGILSIFASFYAQLVVSGALAQLWLGIETEVA